MSAEKGNIIDMYRSLSQEDKEKVRNLIALLLSRQSDDQ